MFSSLGSSAIPNARNGRGGPAKDYVMQVPKGFSIRVFKGPTLSSYPYTATAKFDVGYRPRTASDAWKVSNWQASRDESKDIATIPRDIPTRSSSYDTSEVTTDRRPHEPVRSKTFPSYGIYPSGTQDKFIYERSISSKSELNTPATDTASLSESTFSSSTDISTAHSNSSTVTLQSLAITDNATELSSNILSSSPASTVRQPFPVQIPALIQAQTSIGGGASSAFPAEDTTSRILGASVTSALPSSWLPVPETTDSGSSDTATEKPSVSLSRGADFGRLSTPSSSMAGPFREGPSRERRDSLPPAPRRTSGGSPAGQSSQGRRHSQEGDSNISVQPPRTSNSSLRRESPDRQDSRIVGGPRQRRDSLPATAARPSSEGQVFQSSQIRQFNQEGGLVSEVNATSADVRLPPVQQIQHVERPSSRSPPISSGQTRIVNVTDVPPGFVRQRNSSPPLDGSALPTSAASQDQNTSRPLPSPPSSRRNSDDERTINISAVVQAQQSSERALMTLNTRCVRWNENLICPSPILPHQRRRGWYNRRGDQLWTNEGAYKPPPAGHEFPLDLEGYPEYGDGWMNEEGVRIDMRHRLVPKQPLRSALKRPRIREQSMELNARMAA